VKYVDVKQQLVELVRGFDGDLSRQAVSYSVCFVRETATTLFTAQCIVKTLFSMPRVLHEVG